MRPRLPVRACPATRRSGSPLPRCNTATMSLAGGQVLVVVAWLAAVAGAMPGAAVALPAWESLATPWGAMKVREFGSAQLPLVVLVHGVTESSADEWNEVAERLSESGFHVLVPDFHSAPEQLQPGALTGEVFRELLSSTLMPRNRMVPARYHAVVKPKAVVMGKSWGARMAAEAGALDNVVGVALVVPSLPAAAAELLPRIQGALAICLARDDPVVEFGSAAAAIRSAVGNRKVTWYEAATGGHRVLEEFVEPLVAFAEAARESFVHSAPEEL